jgi:hypothetical protein
MPEEKNMSAITVESAAVEETSRRAALAKLADPASPALIYFGLVAVALGFVMIVVAWAGVAGTLSVPDQLPRLVSGGLGGLAVVIVGLTAVGIGALRRDTVERARQLDRLAALLENKR